MITKKSKTHLEVPIEQCLSSAVRAKGICGFHTFIEDDPRLSKNINEVTCQQCLRRQTGKKQHNIITENEIVAEGELSYSIPETYVGEGEDETYVIGVEVEMTPEQFAKFSQLAISEMNKGKWQISLKKVK